MTRDNPFETFTRHNPALHHLTVASIRSILLQADLSERLWHHEEHNTTEQNTTEQNPKEQYTENQYAKARRTQDQFWPDEIGFTLSPTNHRLIQMLREERLSGDLARRQRVLSLERDQQLLLAGWQPTALDLDAAPSIEPDTILATVNEASHLINLAGFVRNVAGGGPDRRRSTSLIVAFDANRFEWIRTLSRFYRLELNAAQTDLH